MFEYNICTEADKKLFKKQCLALEKHVPGIVKKEMLHDVDDSQIQFYAIEDKKIAVHNDYYVGALYIKSEIELDQFFK